MDTQEQEIKKSSSGRENHGVYLCHKCGWPYPNAHPSAKLRRTHKKVCGTVEGYKVVESDERLVGSDGERASGAMVDKAGVKELGISGGIVLQSYSSADDVFSDAVTEFSDNAVPGVEDHVKDLNKDMEKLGQGDSVEGQSFSGTSDNPIAPIQTMKTSSSEVEQVINQSENANSCSEARTEDFPDKYIGTTALKFDATPGAFDSPVGSIEATAWQFDASPVAFGTPTGVLIEGLDADVNDEDINKTLTNGLSPHVEATGESYEPYLNEIDKLSSDNLREESLTPEAVLEKQSELEAKENKILDIATHDTLVENDISPLEKHLNTSNSVTESDGNNSGVQRIFEQSGEGKDMHVSLFTKKEEETPVSMLEEQNEADIAVYSLSVPDSLAAIANAAHLFEDFKDYASPESSLSLDLGSPEVIKYVGDDKQSTIAVESVPGFHSVDSSGGIYSSTTDQNTLQDDLNEEEVEKSITDKSRVSRSTEELVEDLGSSSLNAQSEAPRTEAENIGIYDISVWDHDSLQTPDPEITPSNESNLTSPVLIENLEETTNLVVGDVPDQNKMRKIEESDEDHLAANDKETLGTDNQATSSLKVHHSQVLKEAVVELSEVCETIEKCGGAVEKNTEVGHVSAGPTQKSSDEDHLAANDKETLGTDNQATSSLKVHHRHVLKEAVVELSEVCETIEKCGGAVEKNTEVGHESAGPTQKSSDVDVQQSAFASDVESVERNQSDGILLSSENQESLTAIEVGPLPVGSEVLSQSSNMVDVTHTSQALKESPGRSSESLQGKGDDKLETRCDGVSVSTIASSRADSMDANWGSISVASLQSDAAASADAKVPSEKLQTDLPIHEGSAESHTVKSDDFEAPSFLTLVEPGNGVAQKAEDPKTAWFPSILDVVNDSQGRKKNEEIIAKVSHWSTERKHAPLKSLLGEARSPNSKPSSASQKDEISSKSSAAVTTVDAILRSEQNDKEVEKDWDSPARYPVEIKKEKKKRKPYWVPFVCCSSMHRDYKQGDL